MLKEIGRCEKCGGELEKKGDIYICLYCNSKFSEEKAIEQSDYIKAIFGEALAKQKEEQIANIRRNLWNAVNEKYIDSYKIVDYCRELKLLLPDDFAANFYEVVNTADSVTVNNFLDNIDTNKYKDYAPDVINFMIKSLKSEYLLPVKNFIGRAYKQSDLIGFDKYMTSFEEEAAKVDECVYDVTQPRDVFVAYSSADMDKVSELVEFLESENLTCFVAVRNLQHGRGAVANYEKRLQEAMDNCKVVVFVSSVASRTNSDARRKELPYVRKRDLDRAPAEYSNDYSKLPSKYKKPRVEYLIENYKNMASESFVKEFFSGNEYRFSPKEVAEAVFNILAEPIEIDHTDNETLRQKIEEQQNLLEELKNAKAQVGNDTVKQELEQQRKMLEQMQNSVLSGNNNIGNTNSLLKRAKIFSDNGDYEQARNYFNKVLDINPEESEAWWNLFLCENKTNNEKDIVSQICNEKKYSEIINNINYKNAQKFATGTQKENITNFIKSCEEKIYKEKIRLEEKKRLEEEKKRLEEEKKRLEEEEKIRLEKEEKIRLEKEEKIRLEKERWLATFEINRDGELVRYRGNEKNIKIPSQCKYIGNSAFSNYAKLQSIEIPNSIMGIRNSAFSGCTNLQSIEIPSDVRFIGESAFSGCSSLQSIKIPRSVTSIGNRAFLNCTNLQSIEIQSGVKFIGDNTFSGCSSLQRIKIPNSITSIGNRMFNGCISLQSIEIPNSVTGIEISAFNGCTSLQSIEIPNSVTNIKSYAFNGCSKLRNIKIPSSVTNIMDNTFNGCSSLQSIEIPNSVTGIGRHAFYGCKSLQSIEISNSVTSIGEFAFEGCSKLRSIKIPNSVTCIRNCMFRGCSSLQSIEIPSSVMSIGGSVFSGCSSLQKVTIPKKFKGIMNKGIKDIFGVIYRQIQFIFI